MSAGSGTSQDANEKLDEKIEVESTTDGHEEPDSRSYGCGTAVSALKETEPVQVSLQPDEPAVSLKRADGGRWGKVARSSNLQPSHSSSRCPALAPVAECGRKAGIGDVVKASPVENDAAAALDPLPGDSEELERRHNLC